MRTIISKILRGRGETLSFLLAVLFAVAAAQSARAEVIDLGGETVDKAGGDFKTAYNGNTIQNGTVNLTSVGDNENLKGGTFTIGSGATVNSTEFRPNNNCTFNIVDGGTFSTAAVLCMPFRYGKVDFNLDNGTFTSSATATYTGGYCVNIGYMWNNKTVWDTSSAKVVLNNGSTFAVTEGTLGLGRVKGKEKKVNIKIDFAVTNSAVVVSKGQMVIANSTSGWVKEAANSYIKAVFGPGSEITTGQIYVDGAYPTSSVTFDGATIHWTGNNSSFIGHHSAVGDVYEIQSNGLTIDIPSDKSLTCDSNASSLKGDGGITKVGEGSITWNKVSSNGSTGMTFTGPLVVSNGTWSSSLSYAATAFAVDGANSTLALSGTLTAAAPDMSATAGGTLNLQSDSVVSRTVGAMTLGEGATLAITGGGLGVDAISANTVVLTATAANPVKIEFDDAANIPVGTHNLITITGGGEFAAGDETKFALDANAPDGSTLSVSGASLVLTVPASNPAMWTGSANDGKFSSVNNWLGKAVPGADADVVISVSSETTLDCDIALNVNSITFPATSAKVTIEGAGCITNAATIVNYSSARHVIDVPVEFVASEAYAPIDVTGEVEFSGGVKGTLPANHSTFYGNYTLTASSWDLSSSITLAENATVSASGMMLNIKTKQIGAGAGAVLTVKQLKHEGSAPFMSFEGTIVANLVYPDNVNTTFNANFKGVLKTKEINYYSNSSRHTFTFGPAATAQTVITASDGMHVKGGTLNIGGSTFRSAADWSIYTQPNGWKDNGYIEIGSAGITIDTADYYDATMPGHTITVKDLNQNGDKELYSTDKRLLNGTGGVTVMGNGKIVFHSSSPFTGGLVASNGVTVAVNKGINPGKGAVTIKDTATFDLVQSGSGTVPVSGTLTMAGGTTLRIPTLAGGVLPLSVNALAFESVTSESKVALNIEGGALVEGYNAIIQSATAVSADAWDNFDVTLNATVPAGMTPVYVAQGGTLYIVLKGANDAIWTGGGENANFSTGANWLGGQVPGNGSCVQVAAADATTLVCDIADFAPASITFAASSTAVTITGENAINVTSITNLSSASHTINVPVYFAGDIQVKQAAMAETDDLAKAHVTFAGGAYAAEGHALENGDFSAVYSRCIFGRYYLKPTAGNPWTASYQGSKNRVCLADNSSIEIPYAGDLTELYVGTGSTATNGTVALSEGNRLSYQNKGEYVIADEFTVSGSNKKDGYAGYNAGTGAANVFKIEKATCTKTDGCTFYCAEANGASHGTYYFGKGGINFGDGKGYFGIGKNADGDAQTIRPWYGDFTIGTGEGNSDGFDMWMFRSITFNTDDENGVGRKITLNARPRFKSTPTFTVAGSGTVLVNSVASNTDQPPVTVTDTATLAFAPGALLTTSNITVNARATLAVAESGTVAIGGDLTLADGACLGFNYSTRNAPVLDLTDKEVTLGDNKNIVVKITSENGKRAKRGKNVLTSGGNFAGANVTLAEGAPDWVGGISVEDGNIVLDVKPMGLAFIFK